MHCPPLAVEAAKQDRGYDRRRSYPEKSTVILKVNSWKQPSDNIFPAKQKYVCFSNFDGNLQFVDLKLNMVTKTRTYHTVAGQNRERRVWCTRWKTSIIKTLKADQTFTRLEHWFSVTNMTLTEDFQNSIHAIKRPQKTTKRTKKKRKKKNQTCLLCIFWTFGAARSTGLKGTLAEDFLQRRFTRSWNGARDVLW